MLIEYLIEFSKLGHKCNRVKNYFVVARVYILSNLDSIPPCDKSDVHI